MKNVDKTSEHLITCLEASEHARKRLEEELRRSEAYFRLLIENASDITTVVNSDGTIRYGSPSVERVLGYKPEALVGKNAFEFFHPDDVPVAISDFSTVAQNPGATRSLEFRFRHKDGSWRVLEAICKNIADDLGAASVVVNSRDITERRQAEEVLNKTAAHWQGTFDAIEDMVMIIDKDFRVVRANEAVSKAFAGARVLGAHCYELLHGTEGPFPNCPSCKTFNSGEVTHCEVCEQHLDGRWFDVYAYPIKDKDGTVQQLVHVVRDITERKRAEEALRESEEKLQRMFESVVEGMAVTDLNGVITDVNDRVLELHGFGSNDDVLGKSAFELIAQREREAALANTRKTLERGFVESVECTLLKADGSEFPGELSASVLKDVSGNPVGFIATTRDITERKRAEEEHARAAAIIDAMTDGITITDMQGRITDINRATTKQLGYAKEEVIGKTPAELFLAEKDHQKFFEAVKLMLSGTPVEDFEYLTKRKDGMEFPQSVSLSVIRDIQSRPIAVIAVHRDMTERKQLYEALRESEEKWRSVVVHAPSMIMIVDRDDVIQFINRTVPGISTGEVIGGDHYDYIDPMYHDVVKSVIKKVFVTGESGSYEARGVGPHGRISWYETQVGPINRNGDVVAVILIISDVTERRQAEEALRESEERHRSLAITDGLTGLYNRRKFYEVLGSEVSRTQRYGHPFSLTMVDLDGFRKYNDSFGHSNGDAILKSFAQTLESTLRKPDTAFRYGGDEFAIVLPATEADRARKIVDRIRSKWLQVPKAEGLIMETPVGFSAGIAEFPENAETADGLVFLADTALYRSKRGGRYKTTLVSDLGALASDVLDGATLDQVYALAATVDARDPYTYGHSKRVAAFSEMIGRAIRLSTDELAALHVAGLLHDIGKVGVPDAILTKPDKPTKDEWKLIRQHPAEGAGIVGYVKELAALVPVILHHHEWYNGTGYPDGLMGEDIPLGARIIGVADAYDTMTTKRQYRDVVSHEEALEELKRCSGIQFDPELAEVFSRAVNEVMKRDQGAVVQTV